jgi:hypothetical protein
MMKVQEFKTAVDGRLARGVARGVLAAALVSLFTGTATST